MEKSICMESIYVDVYRCISRYGYGYLFLDVSIYMHIGTSMDMHRSICFDRGARIRLEI